MLDGNSLQCKVFPGGKSTKRVAGGIQRRGSVVSLLSPGVRQIKNKNGYLL